MDVVDHEKNYIFIGDKKVLCKLCNKQFSEVDNWHKHNRNVHIIKRKKKASPKIHQCIVCSKQFPKLSKLKCHEVVHSRLPHACFNCGRKFKHWDHMTTHQTKCNNEVDEQIQENYKDDDNDQIVHVPSMLCIREDIELVPEMLQMIINIRHKPLILNV